MRKSNFSQQSSVYSSIYSQISNTHKKNSRGRKPVQDIQYIENSIKTIEKYELQLADSRDGNKLMSKKDYDALYTKCSALKSRVKKRQEQMW